MSTPSEQVALYYRFKKDGWLSRLVRWIASKAGYICVPKQYTCWLIKSAIHQTGLSKVRNILVPSEHIECKARAEVYKSIREELAAFRDYGQKKK